MIFLTTGTQLSFDRLVRAVDEWADEAKPSCAIFGQVLPSSGDPYIPRNFQTEARLSPRKYADIFGKADLIISHAGMGTILTALTEGKKICIMPRLAKHGEHRNNHQIATITRLKEYPGLLFKAHSEADLHHCIDAALQASSTVCTATIDPFATTDFTDKLRNFIVAAEK